MKQLFYLILTIIFSLSLSVATEAQQANATLTGVVTDPNGAVVQGATVTATNKATNLTRTVTTNDEGVYTISSLPVGEYEIKFSAASFAKQNVYSKVILNVGQTTNLNTELSASGLQEQVEAISKIV